MTAFLDRLRGRSGAPNNRVPPGQVATTKWPVLHYADVPRVDTRRWTFEVSGLVERPYTLTYDELLALPRTTRATAWCTPSRGSPPICRSPISTGPRT